LEIGSGSAPPVEFSQDGRVFAIPYNRMQVRLYESATGRELATLSPPNPAQIIGGKALEFSRDGQWLVAAKNDGETVAWNLPEIRSELKKLGLDWEDRR
jgi:WD40 repeat protein